MFSIFVDQDTRVIAEDNRPRRQTLPVRVQIKQRMGYVWQPKSKIT